MEKISIIVPVYNCEKYIGTCIESIQGQTYQNLEIILVNDGSKDGSGEICRSYVVHDARIQYIEQENQGVSAARNHGIKKATGTFVMFVDADDTITNDACEKLAGHITEGIDLILCGFKRMFYRGEHLVSQYDVLPECKNLTDQETLGKYFKGLVFHVVLLAPVILLLLLEPHVSTSMVIIITCCIMMIMAGCKFWQFAATGLVGICAGGGIATVLYLASEWFRNKFQYIVTRFITFTDPWKDATDSGWQIIQSLYAIGSGGLFGAGLGESKQKYLYLSEPHNDFIFAVLAEELGFVGCLVVFLLFAIFIWRGVLIAMKAPDMFGSLVAIGITSLVGVQVIINIAVVTSSMPVTGMQLPFFSYGGTALFLLLCEMGVLLSISRASSKQ